MNLTSLFEAQRKLDERIIREKGLEGKDLLPMKILALQVELGECCNEWRGFKFWSKNTYPNYGCDSCRLTSMPHECKFPLLEEYVDCLHFLLSIGLDRGADKDKTPREWAFYKYPAKAQDWLDLIEYVSLLRNTDSLDAYWMTFYVFSQLGFSLGFTWGQIEEAYHAKNRINHERQESGY